jgi:flagellum-specific ATP synthase
MSVNLEQYHLALRDMVPLRRQGRVTQVIGLTLEVEGVAARMGEICYLLPPGRGTSNPRWAETATPAEVVGFKGNRLLLMPLGELPGIRPGSHVVASGRLFSVPAGEELLGRVLDGLGRPIDGKGPLYATSRCTIDNDPPHPLNRSRIERPLNTGVRAIDGLLTVGKGQRIGIFAGSGVGKSTLMGMIARAHQAEADVSVIGLIGERGREVREFVERDLGPEGLARSVVVVSTSDQPALVRLKGAWVATALAEHFRDQGRDVTFLMDSVTRFAMAQREVGLAIGEPPASKGYTPSVFALLPKLMERAGTSDRGTITAFYTVLMEADDLTEPITDTVRSVLDGHIVLSRKLAAENHYPAIDVLGSVSRVMSQVVDREHLKAAGQLREALATYASARDLVDIGAYTPGSSPQIDRALRLLPDIHAYLRQGGLEPTPLDETIARLKGMFANG